jgi:serine/threonine protein kinase
VWEVGDVILGRYEVISLADGVPFAKGGFGRVNRVRDKETGEDFAVKSVSPERLIKPGAVDDFVREAEVWVTKIGLYPNALAAQYVLALGDVPRAFVEFVAGGTLHEWIADGRLYAGGPEAAVKRILDVLIQFAWGLHYCHEQGIVHRDIKPGNLFLTGYGRGRVVKVGDSGLAKGFGEAGLSGGTRPGEATGTWEFMSRLQVIGYKAAGPEVDVWALAASLYQMLTGRLPRDFPDRRDQFLVIMEAPHGPGAAAEPGGPGRASGSYRPGAGRAGGTDTIFL